MGINDDDILDFDFVEEPARETPAQQRAGARSPEPADADSGGGGGSGRGRGRPAVRLPQFSAPQGAAPLLRLVGLVAFAILLVVLLAVWAQGCAEDGKQSSYDAYVAEIGAVGADSAKVGQDTAALLTTPGAGQAEIESKLGGLIQRQQLDVDRARALDPPGPLTPAHTHAVEALQLRVTGLQGLLDVFRATKDSDEGTAAGRQLALQAQRLFAGDVVWHDLFQTVADAAAMAVGVDLAAPASVSVENTDLYSASSLGSIWQRVHGASTGGAPSGVHGSGISYVKALPAGAQLTLQTESTIVASTSLGFEVGVTNTGEQQEVQVEVTLTISKQPSPIVKKGTIALLDAGETKVVVFTDFPDVPFGEGTSVKVAVKPVPGESNTANNSAEYPVVFTLGQ